jgi:hypothetical protein
MKQHVCLITNELLDEWDCLCFVNNKEFPFSFFDFNNSLNVKNKIYIKSCKNILKKAIDLNIITCEKDYNSLYLLIKLTLKKYLFDLLSILNKSGSVICGFDKINQELTKLKISYILYADKVKRRFKENNLPNIKFIESILENSEISCALGKENVGYIGIKDSNLTEKFIKLYFKYQNF